MIREKRDEELGRQTLLTDYGGWDSYREAVSYTRQLPQGMRVDRLRSPDIQS